jgi:EGF-like domain
MLMRSNSTLLYIHAIRKSDCILLVRGYSTTLCVYMVSSPLNTASGAATSRCHIDCSGRGKCNYSTGKCTCFPGYADAACSTFRDDGYNVDSL